MTQGRATHSSSGATKVEPKSHAVSPAAVSQLGIKQGNHASDTGTGHVNVNLPPLYEGRGLQAPMVGTTCHPAGSQGKHK